VPEFAAFIGILESSPGQPVDHIRSRAGPATAISFRSSAIKELETDNRMHEPFLMRWLPSEFAPFAIVFVPAPALDETHEHSPAAAGARQAYRRRPHDGWGRQANWIN
jgi:hypothetical protein